MKVSAALPLRWLADVGVMREASQALDEAGFDLISTGGHILTTAAGRYPERLEHVYAVPYRDPFALFAHLAALTKRLRFRTSILILPLYPTAIVARAAADVSDLSGGRFELGVAISWQAAEYRALGQDFHVRGARLAEQIEILRRFWSQPLVTFDGRFHEIDGLGLGKLPEHPIPILIGCGREEPLLRRVAGLADGWLPTGDELAEPIARLRGYAEDQNRSAEALAVVGMLWLAPGDPQAWASAAQDLRADGVSEISLAPPPDASPAEGIRLLLDAREAVV
jgi:probable F420-dependent oxidoreductase